MYRRDAFGNSPVAAIQLDSYPIPVYTSFFDILNRFAHFE